MSEAPRDGRRILGHVAQGGGLISCYWEQHPAGLIGPNWVEERHSQMGYVDRFFDGWIDLSDFRLLDTHAVNRLLIAFIDDAREADNREALNLLDVSGAERWNKAR